MLRLLNRLCFLARCLNCLTQLLRAFKSFDMIYPMSKNLKYILSESTHQYSLGPFNHCSTLLSLNNTLLTAFYTCQTECSSDQRVVLANDQNHIELEPSTGNPVLFQDATGTGYLLYSKFINHPAIRNPAMKWMFCDLYLRQIIDETQLTLSEPVKIADSEQHLLGRCAPIVVDGKTILPLYDEYNAQCVFYTGNGFEYDETHRFGRSVIQPAIWVEDGHINTLARNFRSDELYAHHFNAYNGFDIVTNVPNNNSSIACLNYIDSVLYLYNNTTDVYRKNLTLGIRSNKLFRELQRIDDYGAYPSIIRHNNGFAFSYTTIYKTIKVKWFENNYLFANTGFKGSRAKTDNIF